MSDPSDPSPAARGLRADPWQTLRTRSPARVALGRAGGSLPTAELLRFALDHAEARDAVHAPLDTTQLAADIICFAFEPSMVVSSQAVDRADYLSNPDHGRRLDAESVKRLKELPFLKPCYDASIVLGDGLSATAANRHGLPFIEELLGRLNRKFELAPIVVARHARVALQDQIGQLLGARSSIIILGERPGLGAADSLGAYLVFDPKPGNTDADRNCVSNIRPAGLPLAAAAETLAYLLEAALRRGLSGVSLKDDRPAAAFGSARPNPALP